MVRAMTLMSRRAVLALPALAAPKRKRRCKVGMQPDEQGVFFQVTVIGTAGGVFVYDSSGNLVASMADLANVDPLTHSNQPGITDQLTGVAFAQLLNAAMTFGSLEPATRIANGGLAGAGLSLVESLSDSAQQALEIVSPRTQPVVGTGIMRLWVLGESKDTTKPAQILISPTPATPSPNTTAMLEVQGSAAFGSANGSIIEFLSPTGVAATDTANLAAILSAGNTPFLLPGTFAINCGNATLTALGPGQYIICSGDLNTIINAQGSGDLFRWVSTTSAGDLLITGGGLIGGATIDGAACSGAAIGIHAGDINALRFDCRCQNFNKTGGSWGFLFDNQNFFTERMQINIRARSCGFAGGDGGSVGFNVGGATTSTGSFARLKGRIEITTATNQRDGLVLTNGAHIYDCDLEVMGNFSGGASATTAAALRITGTVPVGHPGAGTASSITNGRFEVGLECGTGANTPTTFIQGTSSNGVRDCYGNVNWNNNFTSSGITGPGWRYDGQVQGDASLGTRRAYGTAPTQTITANGQTILVEVPSAKIPVSAGAPGFTGTILTAGNEDGQLIYLIGTGTNTVTFAVAGTSNVANGVAAVLNPNTMMILMWDAASALWYPAS